MKELEQLDSMLTTIKDGLLSFSITCEFIEERIFKLSGKEGILEDIPNCAGLYEFYIKNDENLVFQAWSKWFITEWEKKEYKKCFVSNTIKKRLLAHQDANKKLVWIPLYLGKSKNVRDRIRQHIELPLDSKTYAMKLNQRKALIGKEFRVRMCPIKVENYDEIVFLLEKNIRNRTNPILGR